MIDDIGDFDPKKDPKYHRKIYLYLVQNRRRIAARGMPRLVKLEYSSAIWLIGWMIDNDFIGCSIHFDKKIEEYCFVNVAEKKHPCRGGLGNLPPHRVVCLRALLAQMAAHQPQLAQVCPLPSNAAAQGGNC